MEGRLLKSKRSPQNTLSLFSLQDVRAYRLSSRHSSQKYLQNKHQGYSEHHLRELSSSSGPKQAEAGQSRPKQAEAGPFLTEAPGPAPC